MIGLERVKISKTRCPPLSCRRQRHRTPGHGVALAHRSQTRAAGGARAAVRVAGRPSQGEQPETLAVLSCAGKAVSALDTARERSNSNSQMDSASSYNSLRLSGDQSALLCTPSYGTPDLPNSWAHGMDLSRHMAAFASSLYAARHYNRRQHMCVRNSLHIVSVDASAFGDRDSSRQVTSSFSGDAGLAAEPELPAASARRQLQKGLASV